MWYRRPTGGAGLLKRICGAWIVSCGLGVASAQVEQPIIHGFYTDHTSYAPGDHIQIHASYPPSQDLYFRLVRLTQDDIATESYATVPVGPLHTTTEEETEIGSFVEYPIDMGGMGVFTLEGWASPTVVAGRRSIIIGQYGNPDAAVAIGINTHGNYFAYVDSAPGLSAGVEIVHSSAAVGTWSHLALVYDGTNVLFYVDGILAPTTPALSGPVGGGPTANLPFLLGGVSDASGAVVKKAGAFDGSLDAWALWSVDMDWSHLLGRIAAGLTAEDPDPGASAGLLAYLGFEGAYPTDHLKTSAGVNGVVTNHGTPSVSGIAHPAAASTGFKTGHALRLNSDQLVDAGFTALTTTIRVPDGAPSGMYAVQRLYDPLVNVPVDPMDARAIAIRPGALDPHPNAPIAVILPTNTWTAYNEWPWGATMAPTTPASIGANRFPAASFPGKVGNNSLYDPLGDGRSLTFFVGAHRPSEEHSPIEGGMNGTHGFALRARNSLYMVEWLEGCGHEYHVFSDDDMHDGTLVLANYDVVVPHGHHEYWSDHAMSRLHTYLNSGGSVVAPAANLWPWHVVPDLADPAVFEVRKYGKIAGDAGRADTQSASGRVLMGTLRDADACSPTPNEDRQILGVRNHMVTQCLTTGCRGDWQVTTSHPFYMGTPVWAAVGAGEKPTFGIDTVGHETDMYWPMVSGGDPNIPGVDPADVTILATGIDLAARMQVPFPDATGCTGCVGGRPNGCLTPTSSADPSGSILHFSRPNGSEVLVIGASATPWALDGNPTLSGLVDNALAEFTGIDPGMCP